ncbi:hypothetical protein N0V93_000649 [Gnomoniopsis smithogilvyi]|uniref:Extracellular membrane protein CFEM domain-containing protein n=1 Tax=Gnomoniopsis smithogilvyi TaxID=1191159 RepID=A0A9W8Z2L8_9PEZI|nr:hypothetical protein N0V93_000649 [Gnomoniopsis smithogilvyi]
MQFSSLFVLAAAAIVNAAAVPGNLNASNADEGCIKECLIGEGTKYGCETEQCLCENASALENPMEQCVREQCGGDNIARKSAHLSKYG